MSDPIAFRLGAEFTSWPTVPAGAHEPPPDPPQPDGGEVVVLQSDRDADYGDRVEHERQSRLRRWQKIG